MTPGIAPHRPRAFYDPRDPDPAYGLLVVGGILLVVISLGLAFEMDRTAMEYERSRYPTTGGFWIAVAMCNGCFVAVAAVVLVLVAVYASPHRPLPR